MEAFSRILPISRAHFTGALRDSLLAASPLVFEEDLNASYILRRAREYTHNATRAAIAITPDSRLVVVASGSKKIDVPMADPRWVDALSVTSDKTDRIIFKVQMDILGSGAVGSSLEIRIRTKVAGKILELAETARGHARAEHEEYMAQQQVQKVPLDSVQEAIVAPVATVGQQVQRRLSRKPVPGQSPIA